MSRCLDILCRSLAGPTPEQSGATRDWAVLMAVLIVLGTIAILVSLMVVLRHRRHLRQSSPERETEPIPDAWAEAGRRAQPADPGDFLDDDGSARHDDDDSPEESWR